jgi:hypothetical protein
MLLVNYIKGKEAYTGIHLQNVQLQSAKIIYNLSILPDNFAESLTRK